MGIITKLKNVVSITAMGNATPVRSSTVMSASFMRV